MPPVPIRADVSRWPFTNDPFELRSLKVIPVERSRWTTACVQLTCGSSSMTSERGERPRSTSVRVTVPDHSTCAPRRTTTTADGAFSELDPLMSLNSEPPAVRPFRRNPAGSGSATTCATAACGSTGRTLGVGTQSSPAGNRTVRAPQRPRASTRPVDACRTEMRTHRWRPQRARLWYWKGRIRNAASSQPLATTTAPLATKTGNVTHPSNSTSGRNSSATKYGKANRPTAPYSRRPQIDACSRSVVRSP